MPVKLLWVRRMRVLRRMLAKYRKAQKLDKVSESGAQTELTFL